MVLKVLRTCVNGETHAEGAFLPRKIPSCAEEASLSASATVALDDDAVGLVLGAIDVQKFEQENETSSKMNKGEKFSLKLLSKCVRR